MDYNEYLVKLRAMSKAENPRQVYLKSGFNKTSLYRSLLSEARKGRIWAYGEKQIYQYLGYAFKAETIKHRVACAPGSRPDDLNVSNRFREYHHKMTAISEDFSFVVKSSILEYIRGITFE